MPWLHDRCDALYSLFGSCTKYEVGSPRESNTARHVMASSRESGEAGACQAGDGTSSWKLARCAR
jgi:hypothetical protein